MKKRCVECHVDQRSMVAVVQHVDGKIDYVCKRCFKRLDYPQFVREGENEPAQTGTTEDLQQLS